GPSRAYQLLQRPRPGNDVTLLCHGAFLPVLSPSAALGTQSSPEYTGMRGHMETTTNRRRLACPPEWYGPRVGHPACAMTASPRQCPPPCPTTSTERQPERPWRPAPRA